MKEKKYNGISEEMINKIILVAYKDAPVKDRISVYYASKKNIEVKALLNDYKLTAKLVRQIPLEKCPDYLLEIKTENAGMKTKNEKSFLLDLYTVFFARPAVSAVAAGLIVAAMLSSIFFFEHNNQNIYSNHEIEAANKQLKYALSIVQDAFNKSNNIIKEDVLKERVAKPIGDGINYMNSILKEDK